MIGRTLEVLGELLIGYIVTRVHSRVMQEQRIDRAVLRKMRREKIVGTIGIVLIAVGYSIEIFFSL